jgi:hypothetical protein
MKARLVRFLATTVQERSRRVRFGRSFWDAKKWTVPIQAVDHSTADVAFLLTSCSRFIAGTSATKCLARSTQPVQRCHRQGVIRHAGPLTKKVLPPSEATVVFVNCFGSHRPSGRRYSRSANGALTRLEDNLRRIELGTLEIPGSVDLATFLLSDGRTNQRPTLQRKLTLAELFSAYSAVASCHPRHATASTDGATAISICSVRSL